MKRAFTLFAAGSLLAIATVASAGNKQGSFSVSPVIGGISFDGKQHLDTAPLYGLRAGYNFTKAIGIEALFDYSSTEPTNSSRKVDFYRYGGELLYHFMPDNNFVPYLAAGFAGGNIKGAVPVGETSKVKAVYDYGVGAKYFLNDSIALRGDVRHLIYDYRGTKHAVEYVAGLYIPFGGVTPAAKPVEPPAPVAPPAAPTAAISVSPATIVKGNSAALNWTSQNASKCEIQPTVGAVATQGTTTVSPAENTTYALSCTGEGGTAASEAALAVTVPAPVVEAVQPKAAAALCSPTVLHIVFDTNKSKIKPAYYGELKKVADFLAAYPDAKGVIEGHTDSVGSKAANMKLSQRRADSVRDYLVKKLGVAPERVSAKGYGPTKPIASNKTKAGKAKNRRITANFSCTAK